MPRKRKLPPNLRWRPGRENIFYAFDVDGVRYTGSTGTSDVLKAQEFVDRKVEAAYRDIRLGQKEKRDIPFSEAWKHAWDVRLWGQLEEQSQLREQRRRDNIIHAMGDFKLSSIDATFTSKYVEARQAVVATQGRPPLSKHTLNGELATVQKVLLSQDEDLVVLPKKSVRRQGGYPLFPVRQLPMTKSEKFRNTILEDLDECIALMSHMPAHARPIVLTATLTSLRKENVFGLDIGDVDLQNDRITVVQKGGEEHSVPIHHLLRPVLVECIGDRTKGPLFVYGQNGCECTACASHTKPRQRTRKMIRCIETGEIFDTAAEAQWKMRQAGHSGVNATQIGIICKGGFAKGGPNRDGTPKKNTYRVKSSGGFTFEYVDPPTSLPMKNARQQTGRIKSVTSAFQSARKKIERPDVRWHDLRHSIATWLTAGGTPLNVVQQLLGHKNIETTMRYAHADIRTVANFLDNHITSGVSEGPKGERNPDNKGSQKDPKPVVLDLFQTAKQLTD